MWNPMGAWGWTLMRQGNNRNCYNCVFCSNNKLYFAFSWTCKTKIQKAPGDILAVSQDDTPEQCQYEPLSMICVVFEWYSIVILWSLSMKSWAWLGWKSLLKPLDIWRKLSAAPWPEHFTLFCHLSVPASVHNIADCWLTIVTEARWLTTSTMMITAIQPPACQTPKDIQRHLRSGKRLWLRTIPLILLTDFLAKRCYIE